MIATGSTTRQGRTLAQRTRTEARLAGCALCRAALAPLTGYCPARPRAPHREAPGGRRTRQPRRRRIQVYRLLGASQAIGDFLPPPPNTLTRSSTRRCTRLRGADSLPSTRRRFCRKPTGNSDPHSTAGHPYRRDILTALGSTPTRSAARCRRADRQGRLRDRCVAYLPPWAHRHD